MDLTWIWPQPEAVAVGPLTLMALPLRLADLARLQGFLKAARPSPLESARGAIAGAAEGSEARRRALRDAYRACEKWPARLGTPDGTALLATEAGLAFWLATLLGPANPELAPGELAGLARSITVGQHERLVRVAYGLAPLDELARLITPDSFPPEPRPTDWGRLARWLCDRTGWTLPECGEVRLPQLAALLDEGGKAGTGRVEPPPGMGRAAFARRQRKFFGPDRDEEMG